MEKDEMTVESLCMILVTNYGLSLEASAWFEKWINYFIKKAQDELKNLACDSLPDVKRTLRPQDEPVRRLFFKEFETEQELVDWVNRNGSVKLVSVTMNDHNVESFVAWYSNIAAERFSKRALNVQVKSAKNFKPL